MEVLPLVVFFFDGAIHLANSIHLLCNLLPDLYYSSAFAGSHHYVFFKLSVITEISSGEKFGFLFLSPGMIFTIQMEREK